MTRDQLARLLQQPPQPARAYLVGAGGCGVSALGHLLLDRGWEVCGSDLAANDDVERLRARGARIVLGHDAARVREEHPALVAFSSAVASDNPELNAARELGLPVVRRAALLAALMQDKTGICVAGMHGKTTTAALLAYALEQLGAAPAFAIGGFVPQLEGNARWASAPAHPSHRHPCAGTLQGSPDQAAAALWAHLLFVAEADESDGTLPEFQPACSVVLNIDAEHLDYFADVQAVRDEFRRFIQQTQGLVCYCADDPHLPELVQGKPGAVSYGFHPEADYRIELPPDEAAAVGDASSPPTACSNGSLKRFRVWHRGQPFGEFELRLLGGQNVSNAGAVVALLHQLGFSAKAIHAAIAGFLGVARRQEELFRDERFRVFTDYGHHPVEIQATLQAFREVTPGRLLVGFQPHRYTRTQHLLEQFRGAFGQADCLWVADIYAASEPPIPGVHAAQLASAITTRGPRAEYVATLEQLCEAIRRTVRPGDVVLFLGAGDIDQAARAFARSLQA